MSVGRGWPKRPGDSTRAVHGGERERPASDAITTPLFQTSTYWFKDSEEVRAYQEGRKPRDEYGRYGNPTSRAAEHKLAELEGAEQAVLFASGMCATTTTFFALLPRGGHLVTTSDCYRRTRQFCQEYLSKLDVETTVIEPADPKKLAHARGVLVVIDSTFASPVNHRALADGADLVLHSATKYLGGHNDLLAGAAAGGAELIGRLRAAVGILGGVSDPHSAYLLLRGMKTLSLRMARHNENALRVARMLEAHPRVRRVWYPGLESHPDHATAVRTMRGFGGVVSFELDSALEGTMRFVDRCR